MSLDYYESMNYRPFLAAALLAAAVAQPVLARTPGAPAARAAASAPAPARVQARMDARLMYELLLAELLFGQGETRNGADLMLDAARRADDETLFKRATDMAIQSRSGAAALDAARTWHQARPRSAQAVRYQLQVLVVLGRVAETGAALRDLLALLPADEKEPFIIALPALYQRVPDRAEALRVVDQALQGSLHNPELAPAAWSTIGRLRLAAGDTAGAMAAAILGQTARADSEWPVLLALQLFADAQAPDAEPLIQRYLQTAQAKPEVYVDYARALVAAGRLPDAHAQLDAMTQRQPDNPRGWLVKGALLTDERHDAEAEAALARYLQLAAARSGQPDAEGGGGLEQAHMMLALIAERRGDHARAEELLRAVDSPGQALSIAIRRAQLLAKQGRLDEALQLVRTAPERQPEDERVKLLAEAQLLRENGRPAQAYELLAGELEQDPDDEALLYDAALSADRAGQWPEMERLLRRVIELNPKSPEAYNALGYSLADRGQRLQDAKALIEQAVQLAPGDSYIQDSLGWVEFRLGNVAEARRLLQDAYKRRPDPEIAAHLGEVLWTLGEHDAARAIWREGQRMNASNETLVKTLKRLQIKLTP